MIDDELLSQEEVENSSVASNDQMFYRRPLDGVNSYSQDLGFNPASFLEGNYSRWDICYKRDGAWLDICCGSGLALFQAAEQTDSRITGIDLSDNFLEIERPSNLQLLEGSIFDFKPREKFDLITSVHGFHYIGDKLKLIEMVLSWLKPDGLFAINLGMENIKDKDGRIINLKNYFEIFGLEYNELEYNVLSCEGFRDIEFPFSYVGADVNAGRNYTGMDIVDSFYRNLEL